MYKLDRIEQIKNDISLLVESTMDFSDNENVNYCNNAIKKLEVELTILKSEVER